MCGLAGFLNGDSGEGVAADTAILSAMTRKLWRRGPDDGGAWHDPEAGIYLGHRRLAIIDLSPAGHQPMQSGSGRYVIAFNGEIYNHLALRIALESARGPERWRGRSDTETLLSAIESWGVSGAVERCIGMFAFAIWDRARRELVLGRDRLGEKPLYYGWQGRGAERTFLFGSEVKALLAHPRFEAVVDRGALTLLMRHNYIPAPYSIYTNIRKLEPGHILRVSRDNPEGVSECYWDFIATEHDAQKSPFTGTADDAVGALERLLLDAVGSQMMSDVPLGAFLSGGVDSSTVVALMQAQARQPVKTFSIGFSDAKYNEAPYAKEVARHLGTDHSELFVSPQQALDVIPDISSIYCEPFADSSQIPTYLVSKLARQKVTVSLSGDAGDELFGGYDRYAIGANLWRRMGKVPQPMRRLATAGIQSINVQTWDRLANLAGAARFKLTGDKIHRGAKYLSCSSVEELYLALVSMDPTPSRFVLGGHEPPTRLNGTESELRGRDPIAKMMTLDAISYLPDDILAKVDRAAMAVSLESRAPFLDHRVVEFAMRLPLSIKVRDGVSKWPLRELLYRYVPRNLVDRPKMGFGVPMAEWLRGPLRDWAETLLSKRRLDQEGYWNSALVRETWDQHLSGSWNWSAKVWTILVFQSWLETQPMMRGKADVNSHQIEPANVSSAS